MKWITRERPKIDRVACPWLIARFVEPEPEFLFVPADQVLAQADARGAIPYDEPGVELTHEGPLCSFDVERGKECRVLAGVGRQKRDLMNRTDRHFS